MRISWFLAGVCGVCAAAMGSPSLNFQTVIKQNDALPGGGTFNGPFQIVVGDGGQVGMIAVDDSSNPLVLYANNGQLTSVAQVGGPLGLDGFSNLAISGNSSNGTRLTYVAQNSSTGAAGIFQYDVGSSGVNEVAFNGHDNLSILVANDPSADNTLPMQVNAVGQVIFPAIDANNHSVIIVGDSTAPQRLTTLFTGSDSNSNAPNSYALAPVGSPLGISSDGSSGFAVLNSPANGSGSATVYTVGGGTPANFTGGIDGATLISAQQGNGVNAALLLADHPSNSSLLDIVLHDSSGNHALGTFAKADAARLLIGGEGEMTTTGKVAFYLADANGGEVQYYDVGTHAQTTVALTGTTVVDPSSPSTHYTIDTIGAGVGTPMINNNSIVVFGATITDGGAQRHEALLEWQPGDTNPIVLLQDGDTIAGLGTIDPDGIGTNPFSSEGDVFKNSLSNDNYLGVAVTYDDGNSAVLLTQLSSVPEPTAVALLSLASLGLLNRRRRVA